ncbi:MAG: cytochrome c oxidase subunit 3 [Actinomycetota bacterium]|nr:cytochrome c oxidase subunit 3 [Actinomycetota bacterium]
MADSATFSTVGLPAAPPARPRVALLGSTLVSAASAMFFAGLIGIYLARRADVIASGETWLPDGVNIPVVPPTMMLITVGMSLITMAWSVTSLRSNDIPRAAIALGLTAVFAISVINQTSYLYTQMGLTIDSEVGVLVYAITGAHLVMVGAALIFLGVVLFRAAAGQYRRIPDGPAAALVFWYTTCGIYALIWYAIYITK